MAYSKLFVCCANLLKEAGQPGRAVSKAATQRDTFFEVRKSCIHAEAGVSSFYTCGGKAKWGFRVWGVGS